jgi:hypothetical protein
VDRGRGSGKGEALHCEDFTIDAASQLSKRFTEAPHTNSGDCVHAALHALAMLNVQGDLPYSDVHG